MFPAIPSFMAPSFGTAALAPSAAGAGAALSGTGALAGAGGAAGGLAGLGAALGPIGWAGLGLSALGTAGQLFGGARAADAAREQMEKDREYAFGSQLYAQKFPRALDFQDTKREIALMNSPAYKQARGFEERMDTFGKVAGKYGPAIARFSLPG